MSEHEPRERTDSLEARRSYRRALAGEAEYVTEFRVRRADGTERLIRAEGPCCVRRADARGA